MSALAARLERDDHPPAPSLHAARVLALTPSERTIQTTIAADRLRDFVDELCIAFRLTHGELSVLLAGETMRASGSELARERSSGEAVPLCLRYLKPAADDARVAEAGAIVDGVTDAALPRG